MKLSGLTFIVLIIITKSVGAENAPKKYVVDKSNYEKMGYVISVDIPRSNEPQFKRFNVKFPKSIEGNFEYAYSKALYSKNGKALLSYRPQDIGRSKVTGEYYIVADKSVIECFSLVNIYHEKDFDRSVYGFHPPSRGVSLNLSSFLEKGEKCSGGQNAHNYW